MLPAVRDVTDQDNEELLRLAQSCPMAGDIGLCIDRHPDFQALNRLEGDRYCLGVVDGSDGSLAGCVAVSWRNVYVNGVLRDICYVGDLKVHPAHRKDATAVALSRWARGKCQETGTDVPVLTTVLAGNEEMEALFTDSTRLTRLSPVATVRSFSVPVLWRRKRAASRVRRASHVDAPAMAGLWDRLAPSLQFCPPFSAGGLERWVASAPALDWSDYRVAFHSDGTLAGFAALWDQRSFKQTRVTSYSRSLAVFRFFFDRVAALSGGAPLPPVGGRMQTCNVVHVCVPPDQPEVLRALLVSMHNDLRRTGVSFFSVGLDVSNPLCAATKGLLSQPTDVTVALGLAPGQEATFLDGRAVHHEIALV